MAMPTTRAAAVASSEPTRDAYIVGTGMTRFTRHLDKTHDQLAAMSVLEALKDAGGRKKGNLTDNTAQGGSILERRVDHF